MSAVRKKELTSRIQNFVYGDDSGGCVSDIKICWNDHKDLLVDVCVHSIENDFEGRNHLLNVKCVASNSLIKNPSLQFKEKGYEALLQIISSVLQDMEF